LDDVSYPATENNIKKVLDKVTFDWIQVIYDDTVLHNPEVTFVYVSKDNKFGVLHSHTKVIPPEGQACDAEIVGLLSDNINGNVAWKIESPPNPFNHFFVSVTPMDRIRKNGLEVIDAITPDTIHKPDGTSTNTNAELGFPGAVDDGLPAFANLPVLLPVPTGTALPLSKSIAQGIPAPPEGKNWWPPLLFWMECIRYLFERNNGNPATSTAPNSLFAGGKITLEEPEDWKFGCVKESIQITFQVLLPENDLFFSLGPPCLPNKTKSFLDGTTRPS
jgi:hypothetical protein